MLFFDLEFYVPPNDRNNPQTKGTFKFNPLKDGHLLLGGFFLHTSLTNAEILNSEEIWLWNLENEKSVIEKIYTIFQTEWNLRQKNHDVIIKKRIRDSVTCGFSISRIDLPVLFLKGMLHKIAPFDQLFQTFLNTKVIDLSNTASFLFPNEHVLYPKTQREVSRKLHIHESSFNKPAGSDVWTKYDDGDYDIIATRCRNEVEEIYSIYLELREQIKKISKKNY
ncbi:MAG: hypothetical protein K9W44_13755 [Candidatus Lokiarchaeota archaeon]|nr:hypothetical protein [Candidatus Harpocratesius repetitus]